MGTASFLATTTLIWGATLPPVASGTGSAANWTIWIEQRLQFLAGCFAIDVLGFAVMSNHFHVILRNRPDIVDGWSDTEVARRWWMLCPARKTDDGQPEEPTQAELEAVRSDPQRLAELRRRLSDISWLMRMVAEPIARLANAEDRCAGRFWQGRCC